MAKKRKKTYKPKKRHNLIVRVLRAVFSFYGVVCLILMVRWLFIEPFVIPSGSMIPSLLVRDYIAVHKMAYGVRYPFTNKYVWQRGLPERGDVVVFRSIEGGTFMIKRVIGLPGDRVFLDEKGRVWVNDRLLERDSLNSLKGEGFSPITERSLGAKYDRYSFFIETTPKHKYRTIQRRFYSRWPTDPYMVPKDAVFVLGDNRDDSKDSRSWGHLPLSHIRGRAFGIWLSCEDSLFGMRGLCDPSSLRSERLFMKIK